MDCEITGLTADTILRTLETYPGAEWVNIPYRCPWENTVSRHPLISDRMAERIRFRLPFPASTLEIRILAALSGGKLFENDLVTLLGGDEEDSLEAIEALHQRGQIALCESHNVRHWLIADIELRKLLKRELELV
ncbi:hypothetical protein [Marinobacterium aestuariivivens]|uniref:Uncharacterized protein n=1 Tax=Marinobacterium aestuariivivens TaxID=1698799 RepID=A0ABW1ZVG7_9GAMM